MTTARRPIGWIATTAALAVCSIVLATLLLARSDSAPAVGATTNSTADAACDLIEQVPAQGFSMSDKSRNVPLGQLAAAASLAFLVHDQDPSLKDFQKALQKPNQVVNKTFSAKGGEFVQALDEARQRCATMDR